MLEPQLSGHFIAYERLLQKDPARLLQFLADQHYLSFDKYDYTDHIGAPKWKEVSWRQAERDILCGKLRKNPGKALMFAHRDASKLTMTITELLDGPRFWPRGSAADNRSYSKSSISVRSGGTTSLEETATFVEFLTAVFESADADHGYAHDTTDAIALDASADSLSFLPGMLASTPRVRPGEEVLWPLQSVYWANFFSGRWRRTIEEVADRVSADGPEIRNLTSGGLLVFTAPSPLDPTNKSSRDVLWKVWEAAELGPIPNRFLVWKLRRQYRK